MTGKGEPLVAVKFETPSPGPDEVVVEIAGCGVCHTDLRSYYDGIRTKHALPLTLGHEISGHVIDSGANAMWWIDRAVIVPAVIPCGRCDACRRGKATNDGYNDECAAGNSISRANNCKSTIIAE